MTLSTIRCIWLEHWRITLVLLESEYSKQYFYTNKNTEDFIGIHSFIHLRHNLCFHYLLKLSPLTMIIDIITKIWLLCVHLWWWDSTLLCIKSRPCRVLIYSFTHKSAKFIINLHATRPRLNLLSQHDT